MVFKRNLKKHVLWHVKIMWNQISVFINKVLLGRSHAFIYISSMAAFAMHSTAAELSSIHRVQNMPPKNSHCLVLKQNALGNSQTRSSSSPSGLWLATVSGQQDLFPWFKAVDKMYHLAPSYGDPLHLLPQAQLNDTVEMGTQRPEPGGPPNSTAGSA